MDWNRPARPWCNRAASVLAWACLASLGAASGASAHESAAEAPASADSEVSYGAVGEGPNTPPPRRRLDARFDVSLDDRIVEDPGPEFVENRRKEQIYRDPERRFTATLHPDGRLSFRNRGLNFTNQRMSGYYDAALKAQGVERHQSVKRKLLRETYQDRLAMRVDWTLENLAHAEKLLWQELEAIWQDESKSLDERKRIILQRWAECDVDVDLSPVHGHVSLVDQERRTVARRAQRTIEHFVRLHVDDQGPLHDVTTEHHLHVDDHGVTAQLVDVRVVERDGFNFHGALGESRGGRNDLDPGHLRAVALAPDLFEACERDASACVLVGDMLVGRRQNAFDPERGAGYYGRACDAGDPWACYELAVLHYLGKGVERDDRRAARLHGEACEAGVAEGCAYLAHMHRTGVGVARCETQSAHFRARACSSGLEDYCPS